MTRAAYSYRSDADVPDFADDRPLIVFDGECVFCSGWVKFALKHDKQQRYRFLAAQTPLGAALYRAGRYDEARDAFTKALAQSPNNGWVLYGLAETQTALGNRAEAAASRAALRKTWVGNPAWLRMDRL